MEKHWIFGVQIDDLSTSELEQTLFGWMNDGKVHTIVTPNPEFILESRRDPEFRDILNQADLSLPDGVGLRFAVSALTGKRLLHRHTGVDTLTLIAKLCTQTKKSMLLFGGKDDIAQSAADCLQKEHRGLKISAMNPGVVSVRGQGTLPILSDETIIAVGLGQGKQERCMSVIARSHQATRSVQTATSPGRQSYILIGVGGSFDMIAGTRRRAPAWLRRIGLEWVWRLLIEPKRWRRIANATVIFPALVISDTRKHHRFLRACRDTIPEIFHQLLLCGIRPSDGLEGPRL